MNLKKKILAITIGPVLIRNYHHTIYRNHGKEFHDG